MIQIAPTSANDILPVSEEMFGQICRASPDQAQLLSMCLPMSARAQLAVFCYARTHLRDRGRAIAAACSEVALQLEAGIAGSMLFGQTTAEPETWGVNRRQERFNKPSAPT